MDRLITSYYYASYSSETLSIIERSWLKIGKMASAILLHARFGKELWEEAAAYAVNKYNRIPPPKPQARETGKHVSPYEKLYREYLILSDLKPFGCRGAVWIPDSDNSYRGRGASQLYGQGLQYP